MIQQQRRSSTAPLTGVLSGAGTDMVRLTVYIAPVPSQPPPELAEYVHPVYGDHGDVRDWRPGPISPGHHIESSVFAKYRTWRASFASDRFIGERALVQAFLDWAAARCDISSLSILRLSSGRTDFHNALKMKLQVAAVSQVVNASKERGIGLVTSQTQRGVARALIPTEPATVLLGIGDTRLTLGPSGLAIHSTHPGESIEEITGWKLSGNEVEVSSASGAAVIAGSETATLLRMLGRQAPEVEARWCPMSTLLAPLLIFLRDASELAGETGTDLHIRSGWA